MFLGRGFYLVGVVAGERIFERDLFSLPALQNEDPFPRITGQARSAEPLAGGGKGELRDDFLQERQLSLREDARVEFDLQILQERSDLLFQFDGDRSFRPGEILEACDASPGLDVMPEVKVIQELIELQFVAGCGFSQEIDDRVRQFLSGVVDQHAFTLSAGGEKENQRKRLGFVCVIGRC
jgi:hypothetical protein